MARLGLVANPSDSSFLSLSFGDSLLRAFSDAQAAGVTVQVNAPQWFQVEPVPGTWNLTDVRTSLDVYRAFGFATFLNLRILDTNARNLPADLAPLAWDDPELVRRVDVLVDTLAALAGRYDLVGAAIGNEVDVYFAAHPAEFTAFLALYRREAARFRALRPGVPLCVTTTSPLGNPNAHFGDSLAVTSDLVVHTFYHQQPGAFAQKPAAAFDTDLEAVVARAQGKPVAFQEVGFASAPLIGGSLADQAEAVRRFRTWLARQPRSRVPFASWFLYTDWSSLALRPLYAYYGFETPEFAAYLGTLGLRDSLGRAKPAWEEFRRAR